MAQLALLAALLAADPARALRELHITWDGRPYFDLTISNLRVLPRLEDPRLADLRPGQ